jgi:hypothetical protein
MIIGQVKRSLIITFNLIRHYIFDIKYTNILYNGSYQETVVLMLPLFTVGKRPGTSYRIENAFDVLNQLYILCFFLKLFNDAR